MITTTQREKSAAIYQDLCEVIPGGVNSPVRACKGLLNPPFVAASGIADTIIDADGETYIDFCMSWGALLHGHAHPEVLEQAQKMMFQGTTFGATTEIEGKLARKICQLVPSCEKVRFVSSGTEATMSAIRVARGFTKRDLLIKFSGNYHGHADFLLVSAGSGVLDINSQATSQGIPKEIIQSTLVLPFNDAQVFADFMDLHGDKVAAVIVEPIAGNMGTVLSSREFMHNLRMKTTEKGALLILDEVMTGFRVAKGGAQSLYQVKPDICCFSKIMGGGFPAGAFGGRKEIMDCLAPLGEVYQAGTLSGNPVAMAAGLQALEMLDQPGFYEDLERKAALIIDPVKAFIAQHDLNVCLQHQGSMFTLFFGVKQVRNLDDAMQADRAQFKEFFLFLFERGVYLPPAQLEAWFISSVHTDEHLIKTRDLILEFLQRFC